MYLCSSYNFLYNCIRLFNVLLKNDYKLRVLLNISNIYLNISTQQVSLKFKSIDIYYTIINLTHFFNCFFIETKNCVFY